MPSRKRLIAEAGANAGLAWPLVVSQLSHVGMAVTDTLMAGRLGAVDLGAVAIGSSLWMPVLLGCTGLMMAVTATVAQLRGAGARDQLGRICGQSLWLAAGLGLGALGVMRYIGVFMDWIQVDAAIVPASQGYLRAVGWGMPAACFYLALRFTAEGLGQTRPVMYVQLLALAANAVADYVLMFGAFGLPALGAVGAGWASAAVLWLSLLLMLLYMRYGSRLRRYGLRVAWQWPAWGQQWRLLRLGLPIGVLSIMEVGMFSAVSLLMGTLGPVAVAGHQIALNFAALSFMVPLGISMATTVRVGYARGAGDLGAARFNGLVGIGMSVLAMLLSATVMLLLPERIVALYTRDPEVTRVAVSLLFMAALFQLSDGFQVSALGALRGLKDTAAPMWMTLVSYWCLGLPGAYLLGIGLDLGPRGLWAGLILGLSCAAVLVTRRFLRISQAPGSLLGP